MSAVRNMITTIMTLNNPGARKIGEVVVEPASRGVILIFSNVYCMHAREICENNMPLINCPECNKEVSSLASECPNCAYPIAGGGSTQASGGKIQTVEQTGKKYKLQKLLSALLILAGWIVIYGGGGYGGTMIAIGVIWFCITAFISWWHHG